ncbi:MAG: hypothetical protein K0S58_1656 [Nitrospira sp.]|jgi:hypothetical protein|nr:hypothetical protein [Nitrospira sp.]
MVFQQGRRKLGDEEVHTKLRLTRSPPHILLANG